MDPMFSWFLITALSGVGYYALFARFVPQQRTVALEAALWLAGLFVIGFVTGSPLSPPRLVWSDWLWFLTALGGLTRASLRLADLPSCIIFGFFQSLMLLLILSPFYFRLSEPVTLEGILREVRDVVMMYTLCAAVFCIALRVNPWRRAPNDGHSHCTKCGYDLYGLPEARCPECGTRVDN